MTIANKSVFGIAAVLLGVSAITEASVITDPSPVVTQPPATQPIQKRTTPLAVAFFSGGCDGGVISRNSLRCN
ncbi:hypothetical protein [Pseudomonas rhodesiae]|uniref:hypothetical protein n=1 Tax=Pseudomonas rhodesiae TaxID=76760 RepID=UPI002736BC6D|nr:hypothetical protein [Pseudomonas rhodesiae]WLG39776.1 hypothetical protein PSH93_01115 [Pseudomonas rhodesiae]